MANVETVNGPVSSDQLGITFVHEHILINLLNWLYVPQEASKQRILNAPLTLDILGEVKRDTFASKDNLIMDDEELASREVLEFKRWGGRTIVDVTLPGIGRDPMALKRISEEIGINIVTSTGWYVQSSHPSIVREKSVEGLADIMMRELTDGIGETGVKAGVIGEIGCSVPHHPDEKKVMRAAARAQAKTHAAMTIHQGLFDFKKKKRGAEGMSYLEILEKEGADINKLYMGHSDLNLDLDYQRKLLERGITLAYDTFGIESYIDSYGYWAAAPSDRERVEAAVKLCKDGYDKQLVLSQDVCMKFHLMRYGGYGYAHILKHIVPALMFKGVSKGQVTNMLVENPKRLLSKS